MCAMYCTVRWMKLLLFQQAFKNQNNLFHYSLILKKVLLVYPRHFDIKIFCSRDYMSSSLYSYYTAYNQPRHPIQTHAPCSSSNLISHSVIPSMWERLEIVGLLE